MLASEIAISFVAEKPSNYLKLTNQMLVSEKYLPSQISELASAIATLELFSGSNKSAKKLFQQSLIKPNENSVAQAFWVSKNVLILPFLQTSFHVPCLYEAETIDFTQKMDWKNALKECIRWLNYQPFSSRPAISGSYIASTFLDDYKTGQEIANMGLIANPKEAVLLNNLAFALASQNKVHEAETVFQQIDFGSKDLSREIVWNATKGLILFRKHLLEEGRAFYKKAIALASTPNYESYKILAALYLAREEKIAGTTESNEAEKYVLELAQNTDSPIIKLIIKNNFGIEI